jgi:hypothetical protein
MGDPRATINGSIAGRIRAAELLEDTVELHFIDAVPLPAANHEETRASRKGNLTGGRAQTDL